jgi:hypothetical protein
MKMITDRVFYKIENFKKYYKILKEFEGLLKSPNQYVVYDNGYYIELSPFGEKIMNQYGPLQKSDIDLLVFMGYLSPCK